MKTLFLILSLGFLQAHASIDAKEISSLPAIKNVKVEALSGPAMAAVQPVGIVSFDFASCASRAFSADVEMIESVYLVKIKLDSDMDCFGPSRVRTYQVQYSSDAVSNDRVIVLNPILSSNYVLIP